MISDQRSVISDHDGGGSDLRSAEHRSAPPRQTACCCLIFSRPRFLPVVACVAASGWSASAGPGCVAACYWPGFFIKLKICGVVAEASCPVLCGCSGSGRLTHSSVPGWKQNLLQGTSPLLAGCLTGSSSSVKLRLASKMTDRRTDTRHDQLQAGGAA